MSSPFRKKAGIKKIRHNVTEFLKYGKVEGIEGRQKATQKIKIKFRF
ncbi:hypothetical protein [Treponema berlinense]|nr:hypothetical protein [Treponema berlinense]